MEISLSDMENKKHYMAMLFIISLGLRAKEVFSLSWNDINLERKTVTYTNKNGKTIKSIPEKLIKDFNVFKRENKHEDTDRIFL